MAAYPDYPWDIEKFSQSPLDYWRDVENVRSFLRKAEKSFFFITELEQYYLLSKEKLNEVAGMQALLKCANIANFNTFRYITSQSIWRFAVPTTMRCISHS